MKTFTGIFAVVIALLLTNRLRADDATTLLKQAKESMESAREKIDIAPREAETRDKPYDDLSNVFKAITTDQRKAIDMLEDALKTVRQAREEQKKKESENKPQSESEQRAEQSERKREESKGENPGERNPGVDGAKRGDDRIHDSIYGKPLVHPDDVENWGNLREIVRESQERYRRETIPPQYREIIEEYYRLLADHRE